MFFVRNFRKPFKAEKALINCSFRVDACLKAPVQVGRFYGSSAGEVCSIYFFLEFLPFTKTTIGAILKNASSPFEFNSDAAAQGPSNPGRYNAMSSAGHTPRRHSGKRSVIAGMTSVSLALAGLTVPSVVGGEVVGEAQFASAQTTLAPDSTPLYVNAVKEGGSCQWVNAPPRLGGCCGWSLDSEGCEGCVCGAACCRR